MTAAHDVPTLDDAGRLQIDTAQLIAHTLVQANSGGGKTVACRRILEQTFGAMPQWVIDPEGEMHTLRERHPHLLAAPRGGDTVASVKTASLLARRLLETGASCVIDIYDMGVDERHAFVRALAEAAMNQPRALWRDVLVVIDEAHRYCPERGEDPSEAAGAVKNWLTAGRKRGYAMILAVQRLSTIHKSAAAECNNRLIGRTGLDTDQDRAGKALGLRRPEDREALARLKQGRFWVYGPAFCERPTEVQIGTIYTSHGRSARGKAATPPLEEARKYLAQIGDLPTEAEAELKTVEQLKAKVNELDKQLREARGEISRMTTRPADEIIQASREYDAKLDKMQAERDTSRAELDIQRRKFTEAQLSVLRLQDRLGAISQMIHDLVHDHALKLVQMHDDLLERLSGLPKEIQVRSAESKTDVVERPWSISTADEIISDIAKATGQDPPAPPQVNPGRRHGGTSAMQRTLLTVLAQHGRMAKGKAILHAGYASSGKVSATWAQMARDGWITSDGGIVDITRKGLEKLGPFEPLPTGRELLAAVLPKLNIVERKLLQVCADHYPVTLPKSRAIQLAGYASSGKVSSAWAHLCALDYVHSRGGEVTAAKELCIP